MYCLVAGLVAFAGPDSVFVLVTVAWGLMMTCFAPIMILRVLNRDIGFIQLLSGCVLGITVMLGWSYGLHLGDAVFDGTVGFLFTMAWMWTCSSSMIEDEI